MFKEAIRSTSLTTEVADRKFRKITGQMRFDDITFLSTLRALLGPRINNDESVYFNYYDTDFGSVNDFKWTTAAMGAGNHGIIEILNDNFTVIDEGTFERVADNFEKEYPEWKRISKVTDFFRKAFPVLCYINEEDRNVILITHRMNVKAFHYLQCAIPVFLPWYFEDMSSISEIEMELIKSLSKTTADDYIRITDEIAKQYDFRKDYIVDTLKGYELAFESQRVQALDNDVQNIISKIDDYNCEIGRLLRQKTELEENLLGVRTKIAQGSEGSEIMDYFLCNKRLTLANRNGTTITFIVNDYLTYWDEDMAKKFIKNKDSYIYSVGDRNRKVNKSDMGNLMKAIFLDQVLKVRFCAAYTLDICGCVRGFAGYLFGSESFNSTPNPHINNYRCLGNYERCINEMIYEHNYIGAIEQCVASAKSLNFGDSTVMNDFMKMLYGMDSRGANTKCIELPDGSIVEPWDAAIWVKENLVSEEESNGEDN